MKSNMSSVDRILRVVVALVVAALYFTNQISGLAMIVMGIVGGIFLLTSSVAFCPLYALLGLSSKKRETK